MLFLAALLIGSESDHHYSFGSRSNRSSRTRSQHRGSWWTGYDADDFKPARWF